VQAELDAARRHYAKPEAERVQVRFRFKSRIWAHPDVKLALSALFYNKCAYCEMPLEKTPGHVDHFRPKADCVDLEGNHFPDHYWWLAHEWTNLLWACRACNSAKSTRFPIQGPRATEKGGAKALAAESPLLLDPCDPDAGVQGLFVFERSGEILTGDERGKVTVDVLNLNRGPLVKMRAEEASRFSSEIETLLPSLDDPEALERVKDLIDDARPFAALRRQLLAEAAFGDDRVTPGDWQDLLERLPILKRTGWATLGEIPQVQETYQKQIREEYEAFSKAQQTFSVEEMQEEDKQKYYARQLRIERVEIENFRGIANLDITLPLYLDLESEDEVNIGGLWLDVKQRGPEDPSQVQMGPAAIEREAPWTMLLGENACGKSTVMQAVAMTLMGQRYLDRLDLDASRFLHIPPRKKGKRTPKPRAKGSVKVHVSGLTEPVELHFRSNSPRFEVSALPKVLLLAYGATRLLPRGEHEPRSGTTFARVDNLFDPFVPLQDATDWLVRLHEKDRDAFNEMAKALKRLMGLDPETELKKARGRDEIQVELHGTLLSLDKLSDGYQSVLALATDIMAVMLDRWTSMAAAEGVVLLDEVGSHLHPRWRMRVISSLRDAFPKVQFLCTTHDPLCLRGLEDGEVVLMRRDADNRIHALTDLPPVKGLTVNQLLTSEHFGLSSTMDPSIEKHFERYSELLSETRLGKRQKKELDNLTKALAKYDLMGQTRRERLMLEAIDRHLAREPGVLGRVTADDWDQQLQEELETILSAEA
jgi:uncharacterized protein (TIGR02646 family)